MSSTAELAELQQLISGVRQCATDTQYDTDSWRDVDDEGVGGQFGSR